MFDDRANRRPRYTKYEISKLVKERLQKSDLKLSEFCKGYSINEKTIIDICEAKISFNKDILSVCSMILEKSMEELLSEDIDEGLPAFRSKEINEITAESCNLANILFNEIIMQNKIHE